MVTERIHPNFDAQGLGVTDGIRDASRTLVDQVIMFKHPEDIAHGIADAANTLLLKDNLPKKDTTPQQQELLYRMRSLDYLTATVLVSASHQRREEERGTGNKPKLVRHPLDSKRARRRFGREERAAIALGTKPCDFNSLMVDRLILLAEHVDLTPHSFEWMNDPTVRTPRFKGKGQPWVTLHFRDSASENEGSIIITTKDHITYFAPLTQGAGGFTSDDLLELVALFNTPRVAFKQAADTNPETYRGKAQNRFRELVRRRKEQARKGPEKDKGAEMAARISDMTGQQPEFLIDLLVATGNEIIDEAIGPNGMLKKYLDTVYAEDDPQKDAIKTRADAIRERVRFDQDDRDPIIPPESILRDIIDTTNIDPRLKKVTSYLILLSVLRPENMVMLGKMNARKQREFVRRTQEDTLRILDSQPPQADNAAQMNGWQPIPQFNKNVAKPSQARAGMLMLGRKLYLHHNPLFPGVEASMGRAQKLVTKDEQAVVDETRESLALILGKAFHRCHKDRVVHDIEAERIVKEENLKIGNGENKHKGHDHKNPRSSYIPNDYNLVDETALRILERSVGYLSPHDLQIIVDQITHAQIDMEEDEGITQLIQPNEISILALIEVGKEAIRRGEEELFDKSCKLLARMAIRPIDKATIGRAGTFSYQQQQTQEQAKFVERDGQRAGSEIEMWVSKPEHVGIDEAKPEAAFQLDLHRNAASRVLKITHDHGDTEGTELNVYEQTMVYVVKGFDDILKAYGIDSAKIYSHMQGIIYSQSPQEQLFATMVADSQLGYKKPDLAYFSMLFRDHQPDVEVEGGTNLQKWLEAVNLYLHYQPLSLTQKLARNIAGASSTSNSTHPKYTPENNKSDVRNTPILLTGETENDSEEDMTDSSKEADDHIPNDGGTYQRGHM